MTALLRDRMLARIGEMGAAVDYQRLVWEVLGIRGASAQLARKLVAQALVVEDRQAAWRQSGDRIASAAPAAPGVYVIKDAGGAVLYVGKAINLRRRLRAHFADRRWRALKPVMSRASDAEWIEVGSELEALLRESALIAELQPIVNVQTGAPALPTRAIAPSLVRDVLLVLPSVEADSVELIGARADGPTMIQRTRRNGADLAVHARRVARFFHSRLRRTDEAPLAPLVFSWLAGRGAHATRIDPGDADDVRRLRGKLEALFRDERLFHERLEQC